MNLWDPNTDVENRNRNFRNQTADEYEPRMSTNNKRPESERWKSEYEFQKLNFRRIWTSDEYEPQEIRIQRSKIVIWISEIELQTNTNFWQIRTSDEQEPLRSESERRKSVYEHQKSESYLQKSESHFRWICTNFWNPTCTWNASGTHPSQDCSKESFIHSRH